ncbi:MAG: hypothetical protein ACYC08_05735 [Armatimonadota bacterium]
MEKEIQERFEALEERNRRLTLGMETLEKRNRRLTLGVGALTLVLVFAACFAATNSDKVIDVLRVHRLEVVDPDGETRGAFQAFDKDVMLSMGDPDGEHIDISAESNGKVACISVGSEKHLELISRDSDLTGLYLYDTESNNRGFFDVDGKDRVDLTLFDSDYNISLCFSESHKPSIGLFNGKEDALGLLVKDDGAGYISVRNPSTGKLRFLEP